MQSLTPSLFADISSASQPLALLMQLPWGRTTPTLNMEATPTDAVDFSTLLGQRLEASVPRQASSVIDVPQFPNQQPLQSVEVPGTVVEADANNSTSPSAETILPLQDGDPAPGVVSSPPWPVWRLWTESAEQPPVSITDIGGQTPRKASAAKPGETSLAELVASTFAPQPGNSAPLEVATAEATSESTLPEANVSGTVQREFVSAPRTPKQQSAAASSFSMMLAPQQKPALAAVETTGTTEQKIADIGPRSASSKSQASPKLKMSAWLGARETVAFAPAGSTATASENVSLPQARPLEFTSPRKSARSEVETSDLSSITDSPTRLAEIASPSSDLLRATSGAGSVEVPPEHRSPSTPAAGQDASSRTPLEPSRSDLSRVDDPVQGFAVSTPEALPRAQESLPTSIVNSSEPFGQTTSAAIPVAPSETANPSGPVSAELAPDTARPIQFASDVVESPAPEVEPQRKEVFSPQHREVVTSLPVNSRTVVRERETLNQPQVSASNATATIPSASTAALTESHVQFDSVVVEPRRRSSISERPMSEISASDNTVAAAGIDQGSAEISSESSRETHRPAFLDQLVSSAVTETHYLDDGSSQRFRMRLDPPELGGLTIEIHKSSQGTVAVHVIADSPETHALLDQHAGDVTQALADQGLSLSQFDLSQQQHSAEQTLNYQEHAEKLRLAHEARQQFPGEVSSPSRTKPDAQRYSFRA